MMSLMRALANGEPEAEIMKRGATRTLFQIAEVEKQLVRLRNMAEYAAKHGTPHKHDDRAWRATGKAVDQLFYGFEDSRGQGL